MSFLDPWADPKGWISADSKFASGRLWRHWGTGLIATKSCFIYPFSTDFILPSLQKVWLYWQLLLLLLLLIYATLALIVAIKARNAVHRLVAMGAMILMLGQSLLNIVLLRAFTTTGLPCH